MISLAVILLEIAYTRVFSFKVYYYFTYLIIGVSLLGLGAGGILVSLSARLRAAPLDRLLPMASMAAAAVVIGGYFVIARLVLHVSALSAWEGFKLAGVCILLFCPFMLAGVAVTSILSAHPTRIHRLYAADLIGAGLGCAAAVPLLGWLAPPGTILLSAALLAIAGLPSARNNPSSLLRQGPLLVCAALALLAIVPGATPDPAVSLGKALRAEQKAGRVVHTEWSPVFRIDVTGDPDLNDSHYMIQHDGQLGSTLHRFDGDITTLSRFERNARAFPFDVVGKDAAVLIIGSAGGHEVLASLYFGASRITGVELNDATLALLTRHFADYTGRLAEHPRVRFVNAEGRSFLKRGQQRYDLIWLVAPDSYVARNAASSAAFVLAESYLYTVEMIREALDHLNPGGIVAAQFGELDYAHRPNRTARFLNTARVALGVDNFAQHALVASSPGLASFSFSTILIGRQPFSVPQIDAFIDRADRVPRGTQLYAPSLPLPTDAVGQILGQDRDTLDEWLAQHRYNLSAVTDDVPFFWHFVRFTDAFTDSAAAVKKWDWEDAIGERILLTLLGLVTTLAATLLFLPLVALRPVWRSIPYKASAGIYFASIGMGFMLTEVSLIQMLTLLLGHPTYSLSVTLFGILIFTGLGSLASEKLAANRNRNLTGLLAALFVIILLLQFALPPLVDSFMGTPISARVALAVAVIAPVGVVLGCFMPMGLQAVSGLTSHARQYIAWAWAVNGFFSVITSILSTILAMTFGFRVVLALAFAVYMVGAAAMSRIPQSRQA